MECCLPRESGAARNPQRTAVVGLGNPMHGDDGVGLIVAQSVFEILRRNVDIDLIDCPVPGASLAERLIGYQRAVVIDALVDARAKVGTIRPTEAAKHTPEAPTSVHAIGFLDVLALARMLGMAVPDTIQIYGIAIREPCRFSQCLSPALAGEVGEIAKAIAAAELLNAEASS